MAIHPSHCSLAGQVSPGRCLEGHDDICNLQVPFLFQVSQDTSPEEDLTLADAVEIRVQLEGPDLQGQTKEQKRETGIQTGSLGLVLMADFASCLLAITVGITYHALAGLLPIHKALRDGIWCQDLIPTRKKNQSVILL